MPAYDPKRIGKRAIHPSAWKGYSQKLDFCFTVFSKQFISENVSRSEGLRAFRASAPPLDESPYWLGGTSIVAQLVPASFFESTMQRSRPLPPLAVSRVSPSATLILSKPPPPLTTSVSLVYLLASTRSSPPVGTITSFLRLPIRSRIWSSPFPP